MGIPASADQYVSDSRAWDEFYSFSDQLGIRFGNDIFGMIPPAGSIVRVEAELTEGDVMLLEKQPLYPVEEVLDADRRTVRLQAEIQETVRGGQGQEPTEEIRRNLHYWPVYNERLVWSEDYRYFLARRFPEIVFVQAWGEEISEAMWGMRLEHINRIYISAD